MAALDSVKVDPAVERWNRMREDTYKNFRWTNRTARTAIMGLVVIPGLLYYASSLTDAKLTWTAKRKGEHLSNHQ